MLTPEQLAEIRARAAAATPGGWVSPWDTHSDDSEDPRYDRIATEDGAFVCGLDWYDRPRFAIKEGDAAFITHARADIPALLDEVERLTHERDMSALSNEEGVEIIAELRDENKRLRAACQASLRANAPMVRVRRGALVERV